MSLSDSETSKLLARARDGDADAFAAVFEAYRPMMTRIAYRLVGPDDYEDVVMDSYLKAWRSLTGFEGRASLSTWLCRIVRNCGLDHLRRRKRQELRLVRDDGDSSLEPVVERVADRPGLSPDRQAAARDLGEVIREAMDQLSEKHREALLLREVDELSYAEIAAATGVNVGTVMSRLFYAKRRLRVILGDSLET
jgi:RNA polymerase sigma-70 factor (ECF subfamily)